MSPLWLGERSRRETRLSLATGILPSGQIVLTCLKCSKRFRPERQQRPFWQIVSILVAIVFFGWMMTHHSPAHAASPGFDFQPTGAGNAFKFQLEPTGPSFNCNYAEAPDEVAICQDPELSRLDRETANSISK